MVAAVIIIVLIIYLFLLSTPKMSPYNFNPESNI